jgi:hypothetical protein
MTNWKGKIVQVKVYKNDTKQMIVNMMGIVKHFHDSKTTTDDAWIELQDANRQTHTLIVDCLDEYYTIEELTPPTASHPPMSLHADKDGHLFGAYTDTKGNKCILVCDKKNGDRIYPQPTCKRKRK